MLLERISSPADLKILSDKELDILAACGIVERAAEILVKQ